MQSAISTTKTKLMPAVEEAANNPAAFVPELASLIRQAADQERLQRQRREQEEQRAKRRAEHVRYIYD